MSVKVDDLTEELQDRMNSHSEIVLQTAKLQQDLHTYFILQTLYLTNTLSYKHFILHILYLTNTLCLSYLL
jgi:hypothetical protein